MITTSALCEIRIRAHRHPTLCWWWCYGHRVGQTNLPWPAAVAGAEQHRAEVRAVDRFLEWCGVNEDGSPHFDWVDRPREQG